MVKTYNIISNNKKIKCVEFNGLLEQLDYITPQIENNVYNIVNEIGKSNKDKWNGEYTLNQTLEGMKYGFTNSTNYFLDNISEIRSQEGLDEGIFMDCEGFAYDMGNVVNGIPECCINIGLPSPKPCIKIMVDVSFSCNFKSKQINNRGIAITNLVNTLLIHGCLVELSFMMYNHQSDMDIMTLTTIDTKCLPISTIAFINSVDFFRKICFITMDVVREKESEWGRGNSNIKDFMLNKFKNDDIFFIGGSYVNTELSQNLNTVKQANNYILQLFKLFCKEHKIKIVIDKEDIDTFNNI